MFHSTGGMNGPTVVVLSETRWPRPKGVPLIGSVTTMGNFYLRPRRRWLSHVVFRQSAWTTDSKPANRAGCEVQHDRIGREGLEPAGGLRPPLGVELHCLHGELRADDLLDRGQPLDLDA